MKIINVDELTDLTSFSNLTLLLGNFDGVHKGHKELVYEAKKRASGDIAVMLFDKNPSSLLHNKEENVLTSIDDKIRIFNSLGVDIAFVLRLDHKLLNKSKEEFINDYLLKINPNLIVVGRDYTFGKYGEGKVKDLKNTFKVFACPLLTIGNEKIGTQQIVRYLKNGDVSAANNMLGRNYEIKGKVTHGLGNGHKIGFPTANLSLQTPYVLPKKGVYKTISYVRGIPYPSMTNIGNNPTVGASNDLSIETFINKFDKDIYDETIYLEFVSFLRNEIKFPSLEKLKEQLEKDKEDCFD